MREFSQSTKGDFGELEKALETLPSDKFLTYKNRELPPGCEPRFAYIAFQKKHNVIDMFIEEGIKTSLKDKAFSQFINKGRIRFHSMDELISFFYNTVSPLFHEVDSTEVDSSDVINRQKLEEIQKQKLEEIQKQNEMPEIWPEGITQPLKDEIYGQDDAVEALAEGISTHLMQNKEKPYTALFMGPPGCGKTETGRLIGKILSKITGIEYGFIKVDCNTFRREHMIHTILGAPPGYTGYGKKTLLEPVKEKPYHVLLFDEIEKAHDDVLVALMEAIDTGFLSIADNTTIDLTKTIILFTSNIPVDMTAYESGNEFERAEMLKNEFTRHCGRPEISRRMKDIMVFRELSEEAQIAIIIKFAKRTLSAYDAELTHIDENLMVELLQNKTKYGASEIGTRMEKAINKAILRSHDRKLVKGKKVSLKGTYDNLEIKVG